MSALTRIVIIVLSRVSALTAAGVAVVCLCIPSAHDATDADVELAERSSIPLGKTSVGDVPVEQGIPLATRECCDGRADGPGAEAIRGLQDSGGSAYSTIDSASSLSRSSTPTASLREEYGQRASCSCRGRTVCRFSDETACTVGPSLLDCS